MNAIDYLKSLGWYCAADGFIDDEDGEPIPIFNIHNAEGKRVAYSMTEEKAWDAAISILRYRNMLPEHIKE